MGIRIPGSGSRDQDPGIRILGSGSCYFWGRRIRDFYNLRPWLIGDWPWSLVEDSIGKESAALHSSLRLAVLVQDANMPPFESWRSVPLQGLQESSAGAWGLNKKSCPGPQRPSPNCLNHGSSWEQLQDDTSSRKDANCQLSVAACKL